MRIIRVKLLFCFFVIQSKLKMGLSKKRNMYYFCSPNSNLRVILKTLNYA